MSASNTTPPIAHFVVDLDPLDLASITETIRSEDFEVLEADEHGFVAVDFGVTLIARPTSDAARLRIDVHAQSFVDQEQITLALKQVSGTLISKDFEYELKGQAPRTFKAGQAFESNIEINKEPLPLPVVDIQSSRPGPGSLINQAAVRFDDRKGVVDLIDVRFSLCRFENWFMAKMPNPNQRPRIQGVEIVDSDFRNMDIGGPVIIDTLISNISGEFHTAGAAFRRVRLAGAFDSLELVPSPDTRDELVLRAWNRANERFDKASDWALDIRDAAFYSSPDLSGVPGYLVAWENTPSIFVEAHHVDLDALAKIDFGPTGWDAAIEKIVADNRSEVLVAPTLSTDFDAYQQVMTKLIEAHMAVGAPSTR